MFMIIRLKILCYNLYFTIAQVKIKRYLRKKEINEYMKKAKKKFEQNDLEDDDTEYNEKPRRPSTAKPRKGGRDNTRPKSAIGNRRRKGGSDSDESGDSDSEDEEEMTRSRGNRRREGSSRGRRRELDLSDIEEEDDKKGRNVRGSRGGSAGRRDSRGSAARGRKGSDVVATLKKPLYEEYLFPSRQWYASDEGDGLYVRELKYTEKEMYFKD